MKLIERANGSVTFRSPMAIVAFPLLVVLQVLLWVFAAVIIIGATCAAPFVLAARWGRKLGAEHGK